jgi:1,4-alpha-glucan branching enzyme
MPKGYLSFVLHAHLPYVRHPEYDRFLEERWLFEAVTETYIPLIKFFDRMRSEKVPFKLTLSISPTLAAMLDDPLLQARYLRHLDMSIKLADREIDRTRDWHDVNALARMYKTLFTEARQVFTERCEMQLLKVFKEYSDAGNLELITCAATHGFLPLLNAEPGAVRAQILTAVRDHERRFGQKPRGIWLPECGYFPGVDAILAEAGIRYFFVDAHGIEHAEPRPLFGVNTPIYCESGVAAFGRNPSTSRLVWSNKIGYPADPNYRDYYRDIGFDLDQHYLEEFQYAKNVKTSTGIKYHKITGPGNNKHLYDPSRGCEMAQRHAHDFACRCRDQVLRTAGRMPVPPVLVSPYDAELFGHWWFEGPQWIYYVFCELARQGGELVAATPGEYLTAHPIQQKATPAASSWGRNGYNEHWINPKTDWMWRPLHEAAARMRLTACQAASCSLAEIERRTLRQAGRELMLAQSSDWPFIITNGTTEEYARRRFNDHINRFHYLLSSYQDRRVDEEKLSALEYMDSLFPEMDFELFAAKS